MKSTLLAIITLAVGTTCLAQEQSSEIAAVESAQTKHDLAKALSEIVSGLGTKELQALGNADNDTVALRARWELVRRTFPKETAYDDDGLSRSQRVKRTLLIRFLGFVEGRFRITAPEWWGELFHRAEAFDLRTLANRLPVLQGELNAYHETDVRIAAQHGIDVVAKDEATLAVIDEAGAAVDIPKRLLESSRGDRLLCVFGENECVLGVFDDVNLDRFTILCIDGELSAVRWTAEVWAGQRLVGGGPQEHVATAVLADDAVYVFGADPFSIYLEGFDLATGRAIVRFSTAYQ